jgi:hypothetical protein
VSAHESFARDISKGRARFAIATAGICDAIATAHNKENDDEEATQS